MAVDDWNDPKNRYHGNKELSSLDTSLDMHPTQLLVSASAAKEVLCSLDVPELAMLDVHEAPLM